MKADHLRARNMKRYINQLTVAKKQCEKRIRLLGGPAYDQQEDGVFEDGEGPQSQKVRVCVNEHERGILIILKMSHLYNGGVLASQGLFSCYL